MDTERVDLLIVEDDDVDREAVQRLLGSTFAVRAAALGSEARALWQQSQPDVVLLDYRLPDVDGLALIPELADAFIPVIVLTGEESPEVVVEAMQRGAQDYLVKNHLSKHALEYAIANAIEKVTLKRDVTHQQHRLAEQAAMLEQKNREVLSLASALTLAEQRERQRVAQILHDHVQQMLYGIQMKIHLLNLDLPPAVSDGTRGHLVDAGALLQQAIQATRSLTVELSPPVLKGEGLTGALRWLTTQMAELYHLRVDLEIADRCDTPGDDLHVLIFQLVRELLFNVVKHARVEQAHVRVFLRDQNLVVLIEDSGVGFDAETVLKGEPRASGGFGLHSIRERLDLFGGRLEVESHPGDGTRAKIVVPIHQDMTALGAQHSAWTPLSPHFAV
jgi:signal transduction histidine kinase